MHSAPCTNASSSTSVCAETARISSSDISRASTTRDAPSDCKSAAPPGVCRLICVEACSGISGHASCSSAKSPMSCTRMPSTGRLHRYAQKSSASASSASLTSVLTVT